MGPLYIPFGWVMGPLGGTAEDPTTGPGYSIPTSGVPSSTSSCPVCSLLSDDGLLGSRLRNSLGRGSWAVLLLLILFTFVSLIPSCFPDRV